MYLWNFVDTESLRLFKIIYTILYEIFVVVESDKTQNYSTPSVWNKVVKALMHLALVIMIKSTVQQKWMISDNSEIFTSKAKASCVKNGYAQQSFRSNLQKNWCTTFVDKTSLTIKLNFSQPKYFTRCFWLIW